MLDTMSMPVEIIAAEKDVPRPEGSAAAPLPAEGFVYVRFDDPFQDCLKQPDHVSAVGNLIERAVANLVRFDLDTNIHTDTNTQLLNCGHQVSVVCDNSGGSIRIQTIDVRQWKKDS